MKKPNFGYHFARWKANFGAKPTVPCYRQSFTEACTDRAESR